jgi:NADH-quinone oxidoreductase subunit J
VEQVLSTLSTQPGLVLPGLMFYVLSAVLLFAGLMVITARNPVHSVLFLILAFFNAAGLFLLLGAEFVAMILVIVYVGAVAVLFLFVVMMLDIDFGTLRRGFMQHLPLGLLAAVVIAAQTIMLAISWQFAKDAATQITAPNSAAISNTTQIGKILYTDYMVPFQVAGIILLVAMIGAIVLTHRERSGVRRQKVSVQNAREPSDVLKINSVGTGDGA